LSKVSRVQEKLFHALAASRPLTTARLRLGLSEFAPWPELPEHLLEIISPSIAGSKRRSFSDALQNEGSS
jgi:hypothetical protein